MRSSDGHAKATSSALPSVDPTRSQMQGRSHRTSRCEAIGPTCVFVVAGLGVLHPLRHWESFDDKQPAQVHSCIWE